MTNSREPTKHEVQTLRFIEDWALDNLPDVVGIDIGLKETGGQLTETIAVCVTVRRKKPLAQVPQDERIPEFINGIPTDVLEGEIRALQDDASYDPARGGIAIGPHGSGLVGTLGAIVHDAVTNDVLLLTNRHVASDDGGQDGSNRIDQPRGGSQVGTVLRGAYTDEADVAVILPTRDTLETVEDVGALNASATAHTGEACKKRGRTTRLTFGTVASRLATIDVQYFDGTIRRYRNQIRISGTNFIDGGDSGSVLLNDSNEAIGLCFAGRGDTGYANPISAVMAAVGIRFGPVAAEPPPAPPPVDPPPDAPESPPSPNYPAPPEEPIPLVPVAQSVWGVDVQGAPALLSTLPEPASLGAATAEDLASHTHTGLPVVGTVSGPASYSTGGFVVDLSADLTDVDFLALSLLTPGNLPPCHLEYALNTPSAGKVTVKVMRHRYDRLTSVDAVSNPPSGVTVQTASGQTVAAESAHTHSVDVNHDHGSANSGVSASAAINPTAGVGGTVDSLGHVHPVDLPALGTTSKTSSAGSSHTHTDDNLYAHNHAVTRNETDAASVELAAATDLSGATWAYMAVGS